MAQRAPKLKVPSRLEAREARNREIREQAQAEGTVESMFPTYTPIYHYDAGIPQAETPVPDATPVEEPVKEGKLATLAHEINALLAIAEKADRNASDKRLSAALQLAEAKKLCEAARIPFRNWCAQSVPHSWVQVRKLTVIGSSENPAALMAALRDGNAERNREFRERQAQRQIELEKKAQTAEELQKKLAAVALKISKGEAKTAEAVDGAPTTLPALPPAPDSSGTALETGGGDVEQVRKAIDVAASRLPAEEARAHVQTIAQKLGLEVVREPGSRSYFPTVESMLTDFDMMPAGAKLVFLRRAAERIGIKLETPQDA